MKSLSICFLFVLAFGCSKNGGNQAYVIEENQVEFYEPIGPYYYYEEGYYDDHGEEYHDHDRHGGGGHGSHGH